MAVELVDTHAHLEHERYRDDVGDVIRRAVQAGVVHIITIGSDLESSRRAVQLAETYPQIYAAVGIHPHEASSASEEAFAQLKAWASHPRVVAIGEIGLDFYYDFSPRSVQEDVFRRQLDLAREVGLPVVVHDRDAHEEVESILRDAAADGGVRAVLHSFTGSWEMARRCIEELGCLLSFGGMVTFKNAGAIRDVVARVPAERLMLETDSPYLSPEPYRGRRNEPAQVAVVAQRVAELRGVPVQLIAEQTTANARAFFRLGEVR